MSATADARVAVCQEWLTTWGGSDQVASRLATIVDAEDVYTFAARDELVERLFSGRRVHVSRVGSRAFAQRHWSLLLPLMSRWWKSLDLSAFDAVVTCSHAAVNSIRVRDDAAHISYCCTPMRYAWNWRSEIRRVPAPLRPLWPAVAAQLRHSDRRRAQNVDLFLADSRNVADRIARFYGQRSIVVYPPVDTAFFTPDPSVAREDFFLYAGRLVPYKRPDVVVRAATRAGVRLVVAGAGPELDRLKAAAGNTVEFRELPSDEELRDLYRRTNALVFAGVEDFGMVLVEAQACGAPVIAYGRGGATETVIPGVTGVLYEQEDDATLADVLRAHDLSRYDAQTVRRQAERFSVERFDERVRAIVLRVIAARGAERGTVIEELLDAQ